MSHSDTPDPTRCPLCGQPNGCGNEAACASGQPPCWCTGVVFGAELLARIPADAQRKACVCHACATTGQIPDEAK